VYLKGYCNGAFFFPGAAGYGLYVFDRSLNCCVWIGERGGWGEKEKDML
jgi:hypothetical protein